MIREIQERKDKPVDYACREMGWRNVLWLTLDVAAGPKQRTSIGKGVGVCVSPKVGIDYSLEAQLN